MSAPTSGLEQQDTGPPRFRVALGTVLALLRVLAGVRGHSRVRFWAGGFEYDLRVARKRATKRLEDFDPTAEHHDDARERLLEHLSE